MFPPGLSKRFQYQNLSYDSVLFFYQNVNICLIICFYFFPLKVETMNMTTFYFLLDKIHCIFIWSYIFHYSFRYPLRSCVAWCYWLSLGCSLLLLSQPLQKELRPVKKRRSYASDLHWQPRFASFLQWSSSDGVYSGSFWLMYFSIKLMAKTMCAAVTWQCNSVGVCNWLRFSSVGSKIILQFVQRGHFVPKKKTKTNSTFYTDDMMYCNPAKSIVQLDFLVIVNISLGRQCTTSFRGIKLKLTNKCVQFSCLNRVFAR